MDWLFPEGVEFRHRMLCERRTENSGQWFLTSAEFRTWVNGAYKVLYCPGIRNTPKLTLYYTNRDSWSREIHHEVITLDT